MNDWYMVHNTIQHENNSHDMEILKPRNIFLLLLNPKSFQMFFSFKWFSFPYILQRRRERKAFEKWDLGRTKREKPSYLKWEKEIKCYFLVVFILYLTNYWMVINSISQVNWFCYIRIFLRKALNKPAIFISYFIE